MASMHPEFADALQRMQRLTAVLQDHMAAASIDNFIGTDQAKTVEVKTDARHRLTELYIESGLLRLGVDTVARRVNEALRDAQKAVNAGNDAAAERLEAQITDIVGEFAKGHAGTPRRPASQGG